MTTDTEAAQPVRGSLVLEMSAYKDAKGRADETARLLREALTSLGARESDVRNIRGTVTSSGYAHVVVGTLSLYAADRLTDALIAGQLRERKAQQTVS